MKKGPDWKSRHDKDRRSWKLDPERDLTKIMDPYEVDLIADRTIAQLNMNFSWKMDRNTQV